jgi:hypothetical protein
MLLIAKEFPLGGTERHELIKVFVRNFDKPGRFRDEKWRRVLSSRLDGRRRRSEKCENRGQFGRNDKPKVSTWALEAIPK